MLIVCPNCATSYDLDVASLRPNGRKVRCVRCKTVWQAELSHADRLMAAAEALAPVRRTVEAMAEAAAGEWGDDTEAGEAVPAHLQTQAEAWFDGPEEDPGVGTDSLAVESPSIAPTDLDDDDPETDPVGGDAAAEQSVDDIETLAARRYRMAAGFGGCAGRCPACSR
jgi:predicted Zn finger-like uncharacterized protein